MSDIFKQNQAIIEAYKTISESIPQGSTEPLSPGDKVIIRNPNSRMYGQEGEVDRVDGDKVYVAGHDIMTLPHERKHIQLIYKKA